MKKLFQIIILKRLKLPIISKITKQYFTQQTVKKYPKTFQTVRHIKKCYGPRWQSGNTLTSHL